MIRTAPRPAFPIALIAAVLGLLLVQTAAQTDDPPDLASDLGFSLKTLNLPLSFEANHGQAEESISYIARASGASVLATGDGLVLNLPSDDGTSNLTMNLVGGNGSPLIHGDDRLPGTVNYIFGDDPSAWRTNIPTYGGVTYESVYPGIDLAVYGNQGGELEYDFIVARGIDPSQIAVHFEGAERLSLQDNGSLLLTVAGAEVVQRPPVIYQETGGVRQPIDGRYTISDSFVGFEIGEYDASLPLIIDPVIVWSALLGGSADDEAHGVATDADGNVYVTGDTSSANFPATPGAFSEDYFGNNLSDIFVTKINPDGTDILYSTFVGGSGNDHAWDIEVNDEGEAFVAGLASDNFPGTASSGGFVLRLSDDGSALEYSSAMGVNTELFGLEIDGDDIAYFAGWSLQAQFPATAGSFQPALNGDGDGIVGALAADGSGLVWGSYIGGADREMAFDVARDGDGYVYITGMTPSEDFPTVNAEDSTLAALRDAFVAKIMPDGSALMYSTYLGGDGGGLGDQGYGITADDNGNAYVTGYTVSSDTFPITNGAFQDEYGGNTDAFVTKYDADGDMVYSTFLGGSNVDQGAGIQVDGEGNVTVAGPTFASDFPLVDEIQGHQGGSDAFVSTLNAAGSALLFSTYIGGNDQDDIDIESSALSLGEDGRIYLVGRTDSTNFPLTNGILQARPGTQGGVIGNDEAFVVVIGDGEIGGDVDCSGAANPIDSLKILRSDAGLNVDSVLNCPDIGDEALINGVVRIWGDMNCSGGVDPIDSLILLRFDAGLPNNLPAGCPELGEIHTVELI